MALIEIKWTSITHAKETASGDGSTVLFNLVSTPNSDEAVAVYVNGIYQDETADYTISGAAITFVTAPALAQDISFKYLKGA